MYKIIDLFPSLIQNYTQEEINKLFTRALNGKPLAPIEIVIARRIIRSQKTKQIDTSQYKSVANRCV